MKKKKTHLVVVVCMVAGMVAGAARADVVFEQRFAGSTTVGDYIGQDASSQFTAATISADPGTPSYSVADTEFITTVDPDDVSLPAATAEFGTSGLSISSSLMSMEVTMTVTNDDTTSNMIDYRACLIVGYGAGSYRDIYGIYVGDDEIEIAQDETKGTRVEVDDGVPFTLTIYQNDSGSSETYVGPDGEEYTLDDDKAAFFVDGELALNNIAVNKGSVALSQGFQFRVNTRLAKNMDDCEVAIDRIVICDDLGVAEIPQVDIITPVDSGTAIGSPNYPYILEAFNDQPTWDEEYEEPVGEHLDSYSSCLINAGAYAYIDFGPYWWEVRITQTWTRYRANAGPTTHTPPNFTMWWDDDIDTTNDSGLNETTIDFGQKVFTSSVGATWPWFRDVDASADPVIPQARYLLVSVPDPVTQKMNEFAFVGYTQIDIPHPPEPPSTTPTLTLSQPQIFNYAQMTLVDEIDCGDAQDPHTLYESSTSISSIATILSDDCRTLPNNTGDGKYFGYIIGEGDGLVAGKAYVLVVEYPEDQPRSMLIYNYGCETPRGLHTGTTLGDALHPTYVKSNPESLNYGLSGAYRQAEMLFHLHDRTSDIEVPRGDEYRPNVPADGFYVIIGQLEPGMDPTSAGAAVRRIALYEAPSIENYTQTLNLPEGLPQRHLFSREEMGDGVVTATTEANRGLADPLDYFEHKMKLMKFLGFNTYTKDQLEFGANQGWDPSLHGGKAWYNFNSERGHRWDNIQYLASQYGLNILPYYEYYGSRSYPTGTGLGDEKRAEPLGGASVYTHVTWCEVANVDLTDPDTLTDAQKLLDCTALTQGKGKPIGPEEGVDWSDGIGGYPGGYGYIDFGADWDDVRITATWTKSWANRGGNASPYQALYWHDTPSEFLVGGQYVVPQDAVAETTLNFITKAQNGQLSTWTNDVQLDEQNAITPQARYLVMQAGDPLTHAREFAVVGWIEDGGDPDIDLLTGLTGAPIGTSGYWHNPGNCFDNPPIGLDDIPAKIVGAWFRHRPSSMPIGFADDTRERFADDCNGGTPVTRTMLQSDAYLLADYYDWWMLKRKDFFDDLRDYLRTESGDDEAVILYTWDHYASSKTMPGSNISVVTDDPDLWANTYSETPMDYMEAVQDEWHYWGMLPPVNTWSYYEWQHSCPWPDPENYLDDGGVMLTYSFGKLYTVSSWTGYAFDGFRSNNDLAMLRLHCLNENCVRDDQDYDILGYLCCDWDMAGPYCMLAEARAVAYGNPYYIGYHESDDFQRLFPGYVREFNANFLALPALPMTTEYDAASHEEVVVRSIDTAQDGTWLAVVNIGFEDREDVVVDLPVAGTVTDAVTGSAVTVTNGTITLDLWPGQLKSFHID